MIPRYFLQLDQVTTQYSTSVDNVSEHTIELLVREYVHRSKYHSGQVKNTWLSATVIKLIEQRRTDLSLAIVYALSPSPYHDP